MRTLEHARASRLCDMFMLSYTTRFLNPQRGPALPDSSTSQAPPPSPREGLGATSPSLCDGEETVGPNGNRNPIRTMASTSPPSRQAQNSSAQAAANCGPLSESGSSAENTNASAPPGNTSRRRDAALLLGWGRNTLTRKIKELGMRVDGSDDDDGDDS